MKQIAAIVFALGITGLFLLDRQRKNKASRALLLPLAWLLIAGSRNVGEWLHLGAPSNLSDAYLEGNPFDRNLLLVLIAIGVGVLVQRRRKVGFFLRANAPLLLYFGYCLLSLVWSDYPFVGFKRWIRAIGDVVMVLIVLTDRDWLLAWRRLYAWAAFLLLPISVFLIRYYPELGRSYSIWGGQGAWTGVTTSKNELGMICMILGLASLSRIIDIYRGQEQADKARRLSAHCAMVAMAIWLIHVANSATSWACFLFGGTLLGLTSWRPFIRRPALVHLLIAVMLGVTVSALFLGTGSGLVNDLGRKSDLTGRTEMWGYALKLVDHPLFGAGYESFWVGRRLREMLLVAPGVNQAHNGYIEVYLNLGWIGIALLGLVIVTGYRQVMAAFRSDPGPARLGLAYFVIALSYNCTEGAFKFRNPVWISFLLAIMAAPLIRPRQRVPGSRAATLLDDDQRGVARAKAPVCDEYVEAL
jgi:exopolysaccharide production protein ExoQ